jgi:hypothetical protein
MKEFLSVIFVMVAFQAIELQAQNLVMLTSAPTSPGEKTNVSNTPAIPVFEFDVYSPVNVNANNIDPNMIGSHFLGSRMALKMYILDKMYTFETNVAPGNPATTTSIRKPLVYNSVKKIESYLKKSLRKKEITTEAAEEQLGKVVDVALNILYQNTEAIESQIKALDSSSDLLALYTHQVRLNFK